MLRAGLQTALRMIYPPRCLACGGLVAEENGLCAACFVATPFITGLSCDLCGAPLPGRSATAEHCDDCLGMARPWAHGRAPLRYDGVGRRLVLALKHGDRQDVVGPAADWMARVARDVVTPETVAVPVPLHLTRLLKRRYNQSALLSRALATRLGIASCPDALLRVRRTASLDGKSRDARFATVADAIAANPARKVLLQGRPVLVVDDVMTSGATLAACAEALCGANSGEVCVTVLARVAKTP